MRQPLVDDEMNFASEIPRAVLRAVREIVKIVEEKILDVEN